MLFKSLNPSMFVPVVLLWLSLLRSTTARRQVVVLDVETDRFRQWQIRGDYMYVPIGRQLLEFKDKLPSKFPFTNKFVRDARGIWIVLPSLDPTFDTLNSTGWTNTVTFSFSTSAQLLDSVKIVHNSGTNSTVGHPEITVYISSTKVHTFTPQNVSDDWIIETVPLHGSNRFSIDATTHDEGDFILIDKIEVVFVETTTSPRPPRTSTTPATTSRGHKAAGPRVNVGIISIQILMFTAFTKLKLN